MTRARRVSEGEHTHSARLIDHDPDHPVLASPEPQEGEARNWPERMCQQCENAAEPDTAYFTVVAASGIGHYTADEGTTLCGRDSSKMPTALTHDRP